jgi:glycosyltransferase involved in cell wall biosynthesis
MASRNRTSRNYQHPTERKDLPVIRPHAAQDLTRAAPRGSVSVVIPAKNEARNIGWVLERIPSYVDEIIVVDGLSTDGTLDIAKMIAPDVVVIHEMRSGKGAALRAGFEAARGDFVIMIDADGSMDPGEIDTFVDLLEEGYELVKGSRYLEGGGTTDITWLRSVGNACLREIANFVYGTSYSELCYGYMGFRRKALYSLELDADGFEIETQIVARATRRGLRIAEMPSNEFPRRYGESNLNAFRDGLRVLRTLLIEWRGSTARPNLTPSDMQPIRVRATEETFERPSSRAAQ